MMKKYRAIVVDDESSARNIICSLLERHCPEIQVVATCMNLPEAVEAIKSEEPELVFLDIELPNYAGYEIISFFDSINFEIIFVTAYNQYAMKAFEVSAVDYILKPIEIERLKLAVGRFIERSDLKHLQRSYEVLKETLSKKKLSKIVIPHNGEQKIILISTILAIEAKEAYTSIIVSNGSRYMVSKNLKHFENLLEENGVFFRTHKSWLINLDHIQSYSKADLTIHLAGNINAKLSKYKKADFETSFARN